MVAVIGMTAQISPMVGLYTASAVPTMNPPPTHVAVRGTHTHTQDSPTGSRGQYQTDRLLLLHLPVTREQKPASVYCNFDKELNLNRNLL